MRCSPRLLEVNGEPWLGLVARQAAFSECILYGRYADTFGVGGRPVTPTDDSRCLSYWETSPITSDAVAGFVARLRPTDLAVQIQSVSGTDPDVREQVIREIERIVEG